MPTQTQGPSANHIYLNAVTFGLQAELFAHCPYCAFLTIYHFHPLFGQTLRTIVTLYRRARAVSFVA